MAAIPDSLKYHVLIIDDDPRIATLLSLMLKKTGMFDTTTETRPRHAAVVAKSILPDAILLDVDMPGRNGAEVANEIRSDRLTSDIPIIFLTTLVLKHEAELQTLVLNGIPVLSKPVEPMLLLDRLSEVLQFRTESTNSSYALARRT